MNFSGVPGIRAPTHGRTFTTRLWLAGASAARRQDAETANTAAAARKCLNGLCITGSLFRFVYYQAHKAILTARPTRAFS
jgi:hypothetical protein